MPPADFGKPLQQPLSVAHADDACTAACRGAGSFASSSGESQTAGRHRMDLIAVFAVGLGAALGAWLRWFLSLLLNAALPTLPLGTLAANVLGGLLMGLVIGAFMHYQNVPAPWRLFITTGFLGGLTTFSTFSGEAITLLLHEQYGWFVAQISTNVVGSLAATLVGVLLMRGLVTA